MSAITAPDRKELPASSYEKPSFPYAIGATLWPKGKRMIVNGWQMPDTIDFTLKLAKGRFLTDSQFSTVLEVTQRYLESTWYSHAPGELSNQWRYLKPFIKFLINDREVLDYSDVWGIDDYISYVKQLKRNVSSEGLFPYLNAVKRLWVFSGTMRHGLNAEPWPGRTSSAVAGLKARSENSEKPYALNEFAGMVHVALRDLAGIDDLCLGLRNLDSVTDHRPWLLRISALRTAAAVLIYSFVGLRPEELVKLRLDCIVYRFLRTNTGEISVPWLDGRIFKDRPPGGEPHSWIAADEVVLAVAAMQKLRAELNSCVERDCLWPSRKRSVIVSRDFLFPRLECADSVEHISRKAVASWLARFSERDEVRAAVNKRLRVNQRRFRPTVARAMSALKLGDASYFMAHYGHLSFSTTAGYFETFADDQFKAEVADAMQSRMQDVVAGILSSSSPLLGRRGKEMEPLRRQYAVLTFKSKQELVRHFVKGHHLKIQAHSFCIAPKDIKLCPPGCIYEETDCLNCHNGVVTKEQEEVWKEIESRTLAFVGEFEEGSPAHAACMENLAGIKSALDMMRTNGSSR